MLYEDLTEKALFGEISFDVTDRWQITVGARYYDYSFDSAERPRHCRWPTRCSSARAPDEIDLDFERPRHPGRQRLAVQVQHVVSLQRRRAGLLHDQRGLSNRRVERHRRCATTDAGDSRTSARCPTSFSTSPDTTTNYEIGLRSQWLDGRLTLNGALYYIDWQDPQLASATANGAQPITKNGEGAETSGIEIALDAARHRSLQPRLQLLALERPSSPRLRRT